MTYDPEFHHRRSIRIPDYDYATPNWYFVTVCVAHHARLLGRVAGDEVYLSPAGEMVANIWSQIPDRFPDISLDLSVVMPDHLHGIVAIHGATSAGQSHSSVTLTEILHWFKTITTTAYGRGVRRAGWQPYQGHLWQRTFYDHVIRNDRDLDRVRTYILDNPVQWSMDDEARRGPDSSP
jgi:REP element-mobilizing transposase RayT